VSHTNIRPAALAGTWYPGSPAVLADEIRRFMAEADRAKLPTGRPVVLLVPHAGYAYSGPTAGRGWGLLAGLDYDRVFVLAPNHRHPLQQISYPEVEAYATPLGDVPVDRIACDCLADCEAFRCDPVAHEHEHAEEIQLPFLQTILAPETPIIPLLVPRLTGEQRFAAAAALGAFVDGRSLFVISTDMTHYGADYGYVPFAEDIPDNLRRLDMDALAAVADWDAARLLDYGRKTGITMCGLEATALVMSLPWAGRPQTALIDYTRSGDRDDDYAFSVSYAAVVGCLEDSV